MSLKEINARARVLSGLRYRARLSGIDCAASWAAFFLISWVMRRMHAYWSSGWLGRGDGFG
jgi:hypothetical protein